MTRIFHLFLSRSRPRDYSFSYFSKSRGIYFQNLPVLTSESIEMVIPFKSILHLANNSLFCTIHNVWSSLNSSCTFHCIKVWSFLIQVAWFILQVLNYCPSKKTFQWVSRTVICHCDRAVIVWRIILNSFILVKEWSSCSIKGFMYKLRVMYW